MVTTPTDPVPSTPEEAAKLNANLEKAKMENPTATSVTVEEVGDLKFIRVDA